MDFTGDFETHITVEPGDSGGIERLHRWSQARALKITHIILARGETPSQPMITRHGRGDLAGELQIATRLSHDLEEEGFAISRIKIEASPANPGVPRTREEARILPNDRYFEHHIKLRLPPSSEFAELSAIAERHGAHLSRNALRTRTDGDRERFVTQRCHSIGRDDARQRLDSLVEAIGGSGFEILEVEEEFVVYDSNLAMDSGWIKSER